jgi:hypothetical protein
VRNHGPARCAEIEGVNTLSALTHRQIFDLVARQVVEPELLDERQEADPQAACSRAHKLVWSLDQDQVVLEELLDGCYVVSADVEAAQMDEERIVAAYKALGNVERAFRTGVHRT